MSEYILEVPDLPNNDPDPRGLGCVLLESMRKHGDKIAQIDAETGETQTYNELLLRSIRVAQQLQARGTKPADVITICSLNIMDSYAVYVASLFIGAYISALDPSLSDTDVAHLLKQVKPKFLFCGVESLELIEKSLENAEFECDMVVFGETEKYIPFSEFVVSSGTEDTFEARPVEDIYETAIIFFSSGTTGLPKGICATHYGMLGKGFPEGNPGPKEHATQVYVYFTTLYWISASATCCMSIVTGAARLLFKKFDVELALQLIEKHKASFMFISPFIMHSFIQHPKINDYDMKSLRFVIIGGGSVPEKQLLEFKKLVPYGLSINGYGLTEAHGGAVGFDPRKDYKFIIEKPTSAGKPLPGLSYKIVDVETDEICGPNRQGEIRMKGKSLIREYYNKPEETAKAFDEDGFLYTGDIGYYDEDHCFYIVGRIKEIFRFQSWHIIPADLENILMSHPDIKEAAVIGIPHEVDGERPMAVVVLKPGSTQKEEDILNFFNDQVSDRKKLRAGVKIMDSLPYTPTGKMRKRYLRQCILENNLV